MTTPNFNKIPFYFTYFIKYNKSNVGSRMKMRITGGFYYNGYFTEI